MSKMIELFVYGTLKQGGKWHFLLNGQEMLDVDSVEGELYLEKGGYYPIMFEGSDQVMGEIYLVNAEVMARIMALEGEADYDIKRVTTQGGYEVTVFFFNDQTQRRPEQKIEQFDASAFFELWLLDNPVGSQGFIEYLNWQPE